MARSEQANDSRQLAQRFQARAAGGSERHAASQAKLEALREEQEKLVAEAKNEKEAADAVRGSCEPEFAWFRVCGGETRLSCSPLASVEPTRVLLLECVGRHLRRRMLGH